MEKRKRRRFTAEYEAETAKQLAESGKARQQVAEELGGPRQPLRGWRHERLAIGSAGAAAPREGAVSKRRGAHAWTALLEGWP